MVRVCGNLAQEVGTKEGRGRVEIKQLTGVITRALPATKLILSCRLTYGSLDPLNPLLIHLPFNPTRIASLCGIPRRTSTNCNQLRTKHFFNVQRSNVGNPKDERSVGLCGEDFLFAGFASFKCNVDRNSRETIQLYYQVGKY